MARTAAAPARHVLFISYYFPPLANSGTFRSLKFVRYLPANGWMPTVIAGAPTPLDRIDPALLGEIPPGVDVRRTPLLSESTARTLGRWLRPLVDECWLYEGLAWRLRNLSQVPDEHVSWRWPAFAAALRASRQSRFDLVFATGYPWTSLLVGRSVARRLGVPFVADFRDPWTPDDIWRGPLSARQACAHRRLERSVLRAAAAVVSVNEHLSDSLRALGASSVVTIPNGFDGEQIKAVYPQPRREPRRLRIVYAGVWKERYIQCLETFYHAVGQLHDQSPSVAEQLEVVTAGFPSGRAAQLGLANVITELGPVSHAQALSMMRSADVLVLPLAEGVHRQLQVPGKIYEYLACERPVLAMADPAGATGTLLRRLGGGVCVPADDPEGLVALLSRAIREGGLTVPPLRKEMLLRYDRQALTSRLAQVFDTLTAV